MPPVAAGRLKVGNARLTPRMRAICETGNEGCKSSLMVPVPVAVARVAFTGEDRVTTTVSPLSLRVSLQAAMPMVAAVAPGAKVSVPAASAV